MAKANPFRFSTKYQDDETDLIYYTFRYYNASTGRWLSKDPSAIRDGNEYLFVKNNSLSGYDVLGLWLVDVHKDMTTRWAGELGIDSVQSANIGVADISIDDQYSVFDVNDWNWSWHFNRSLSGDSRLKHRDIEFEKAKKECSATRDNPYNAAAYLGRALHPLQDVVAHGDFNRKAEFPNPSLWEDGFTLWHNYLAGGYNTAGYPDDPNLDAKGPYGQPTADVMHWGEGGGNKKIGWTEFSGGKQRIKHTEDISKQLLKDFQQHVRANAKAGCECRKAFLGTQ
jgi:RHS repeat-associated protein